MAIKTITFEYGYTFNLGNYSSVRPVVTFTSEIQEGDDPDRILAELQEWARAEVEGEIDRALVLSGKAPHFERLRNRSN